MSPGDLIKYRNDYGCFGEEYSIGLCLRKESSPHYPECGDRMLVLWFDDLCKTHEDLDVCERQEYMELLSEAR